MRVALVYPVNLSLWGQGKSSTRRLCSIVGVKLCKEAGKCLWCQLFEQRVSSKNEWKDAASTGGPFALSCFMNYFRYLPIPNGCFCRYWSRGQIWNNSPKTFGFPWMRIKSWKIFPIRMFLCWRKILAAAAINHSGQCCFRYGFGNKSGLKGSERNQCLWFAFAKNRSKPHHLIFPVRNLTDTPIIWICKWCLQLEGSAEHFLKYFNLAI